MNTYPLPIQKSELPLDAGMLDGLSDPVFLVDPSHVIVDYNRAAKQLLGEDALSVRRKRYYPHGPWSWLRFRPE